MPCLRPEISVFTYDCWSFVFEHSIMFECESVLGEFDYVFLMNSIKVNQTIGVW